MATWLRRVGLAGFAFFTIKGCVWLLVMWAAWSGLT
jgi:hypothetical protein